jgi:hypothetical protein
MIHCSECGTRVPASLAGADCPGCGVPLVGGPRSEETGNLPAPVRGPSKSVLIRDLLIFEVKLLLDGLGDLVLSQVAILALIWDLIRGGPETGKTFYRVLRAGEKWDLWLNLYRPATDAQQSSEGLLEAGLADANSLLGKIESIVKDRSRGGSGADRGD